MRYHRTIPWAQQQPAQQDPVPVPAGAEIETTIPIRPAALIADLVVPLGQALVTGALMGGLAVLALGELAPGLDVEPLKLWSMSAMACAAITWILLLGQTRRMLGIVETITGHDLDGDGKVGGQPIERVVFVNAPQAAQEASRRQQETAAGNFEKFIRAIPARGTNQAVWEKSLGRDTYNEYRDALIQMGWAAWRSVGADGTPNRSQGWELTLDPDEILNRISS